MKTDAPFRISTLLGSCLGAGLLTASVVIGAAQQSPQSSPPAQNPPGRPNFRTNTNAVIVDLRVVDKDEQFVADLTKDDFRVFEDDKEQTVTTVSLVDIPITSRTERVGVPSVSPDVVSNSHVDEGRLYVIVLDDLEEEGDDSGLYQGHRSVTVRAIARDFVEHHLSDGDRAALMTTSGRRNMTVQFTNDRRRLLDTIDGFQGGFGGIDYYCAQPNSGGQCVFVKDNLHSVMVSLTSLAEWLAQINGRRKSIVLVSDRLGRSMKREINMDLASHEAADVQAFVAAAARGNVSLYAIDPVGQPTGTPGNIKPLPLDDLAWLDLDRTQSLEIVSETTGGFAATHTNNYARAFDRVVEENSFYYLLGYTPSNVVQDGKFRKIRVEVKRADGKTSIGRVPEFHVRARSGYAAGKPPAKTVAPVPDVLPPDLLDLMKSPLPVAGLTMSVAVMPFRRTAETASVAVVVEARPSALMLANPDTGFSGTMEIAIAAAGTDGKILGGESGSLTMNLSAAARERIAAQGVRMLSSIDLSPGDYHVSVAASDGQARGSVRYDVTVPDFSKPLAMSGIALGSIETSRVQTKGTDARWNSSLGMPPTTAREFGTTDELRTFVEIYDNDQRPHETRVTVSVRSDAGKTMFEQQQTLKRIGDQTTYPVVTPIPLVDVPPGSYVLTVEALNSERPREAVSRQIPFTVR